MGIHLLILLLGLVLVIKGGDLFVDSSIHIARFLHVPRMIIGGTLVSLATTAPELVVSTTASWMGDSGIALGNAVGSAICNIGLIIGCVAVMIPVEVDPKDFRRRFLWMLAASILVLMFSWNLSINRTYGSLLILLAALYLYDDYRAARTSRRAKVALPLDAGEEGSHARSVLFFVMGALLVILGSRMLVDSGVAIAKILKIPSVIIGLTVISVGTSLPELVTGVTSAIKKVPDLSVGNIIGANFFDMALIVGASSVIRPITLSEFTRNYSYAWLFVMVVVMMGALWGKGRAGKKTGWLLLSLYAVYVFGLVLFGAIEN